MSKGSKVMVGSAKGWWLSALWTLALILVQCKGSGPETEAVGAQARAGQRPLGEGLALQVSEGDRCPVCAMQVAEHQDHAAALALDDGTTYYFCGNGCMMRSWLVPEAYLGVAEGRLALPVVQEYYSRKPMDAREVLWVADSDVQGPMGVALVPLADAAAAETFRRRHGGKAPFRFEELRAETWEGLTGKGAKP